MDGQCQLPVGGFEWVENTSQFKKDFIKSYNENNKNLCFVEINVQYPKNYMTFTRIFHFYLKNFQLPRLKKNVLHTKNL